MNAFLKDIIKIPIYVEMILMKLKKSGYYLELKIDLPELIEKDLVQTIETDLKTLSIKEYIMRHNQTDMVLDDEIEKTLIYIKKKLFKRSKELSMIEFVPLIK